MAIPTALEEMTANQLLDLVRTMPVAVAPWRPYYTDTQRVAELWERVTRILNPYMIDTYAYVGRVARVWGPCDIDGKKCWLWKAGHDCKSVDTRQAAMDAADAHLESLGMKLATERK